MAFYRNVGLIGHAQVGKDTMAGFMGQRYAYQRVAFADRLKSAALDVNPVVGFAGGEWIRLAHVVRLYGWEYAKATFPETRRFLQHYGQTVRAADPDFWIRAALPAMDAIRSLNLPIVVTDVRYRNEAHYLRSKGFKLIRVTRPNGGLTGDAAKHDSETELDDFHTDLTVSNSGTTSDLSRIVDSLLLRG
ncbi:deoxynucleoside monophosphate kinase [Streptomyces phage Euratis]|uniref:Deoxynucleoside monophosphate kinase n=1 Tax=Streptomyces phage Euratis TaxID=2510569 RepID=A0A411B101_9CAUD|nr:deoxynucleoside monophosphate kinase [Streptomyces phage Euratis]